MTDLLREIRAGIWVLLSSDASRLPLPLSQDVAAAEGMPGWRAAEFLAGRRALRHLLSVVVPRAHRAQVGYSERGRPYLVGWPGLGVSITHDKHTAAACVATGFAVGVDVQHPRDGRRFVAALVPAGANRRAASHADVSAGDRVRLGVDGAGGLREGGRHRHLRQAMVHRRVARQPKGAMGRLRVDQPARPHAGAMQLRFHGSVRIPGMTRFPDLSCYTTNLVAYLEPKAPAIRRTLARAIRVAVRTDLPAGELAFSHHPKLDADETGQLAYRSAPDWDSAHAALRDELDRAGRVLACCNTFHLPWSPAYRLVHTPHWVPAASAGRRTLASCRPLFRADATRPPGAILRLAV